MTNSDIGQNLENIRNLLDIDAPEGNNADDMFEDVLKHNLWGIHIKLENDALSDTNPHVCIGWSDMGDMSSLNTTDDLCRNTRSIIRKIIVQKVRMLE